MKKIFTFVLLLSFVFVFSACNQTETVQGTTETFTRAGLVLEVSGVSSQYTVDRLSEGIEPYVETVYVCYPGAKLTIVDADMSDPAYTEDQKPHPQWGIYDVETDQRTKLTEDLGEIALDHATDFVYHLESSVGVLRFEFIEE